MQMPMCKFCGEFELVEVQAFYRDGKKKSALCMCEFCKRFDEVFFDKTGNLLVKKI